MVAGSDGRVRMAKVETWNVLCAMSHNLATAMVFFVSLGRGIAGPQQGGLNALVTLGVWFVLLWPTIEAAKNHPQWQ